MCDVSKEGGGGSPQKNEHMTFDLVDKIDMWGFPKGTKLKLYTAIFADKAAIPTEK
jgi:hypothetical protein